MPIESSEIKLQRSASAGSLGGARSNTASGNDLFDKVSAAEASAGRIEFRCVYVQNVDPALVLKEASISVFSDSTSPSTAISIGVGTSAVGGVEQTVASETTAPSGVVFGTTVALGDIPPNGHRAVWIRRSVTAGAAATDNDATTLRVSGSYIE